MLLSLTQELGRLEEFFSEVIYPAWPLWLAAAVVALGATGFLAYRMGWHRVAARHAFLSSAIAAVLIAAVALGGYYTISPLFDRNTVCEASPITGAGTGSDKCGGDVAVAATMPPNASPTLAPSDAPSSPTIAPADAATATPFAPFVQRRGTWQSADDFHYTIGDALLIETEPGKYMLRVENFSVRNGPDVYVLLSTTNGYTSEALNLGGLKGTDGAFNYDIPAGTDVSQFRSAIIWCKQFDVLFGHAELL
jgi:hypothetical protein